MKTMTRSKAVGTMPSCLYTLKVILIEGPIAKDFALRNPEVSRTIRISGSSTLSDLHHAIAGAFDRTGNRPYEFQFDLSPSRHLCYGDPEQCRDIYGAPVNEGDTSLTTLGTLDIKAGDCFGYWYDFAEIWLHRIDVLDVSEETSPVGPDVIERVGESPSSLPVGKCVFDHDEI